MNTDKYKQVAVDCADIFAEGYVYGNGRVEAYEPAEYQMGLTLAMAVYLKSMFPHELEDMFRLHCENLRMTLEELDAKSHKDDIVEVSGVRLD